jgi:hypothetical protein
MVGCLNLKFTFCFVETNKTPLNLRQIKCSTVRDHGNTYTLYFNNFYEVLNVKIEPNFEVVLEESLYQFV